MCAHFTGGSPRQCLTRGELSGENVKHVGHPRARGRFGANEPLYTLQPQALGNLVSGFHLCLALDLRKHQGSLLETAWPLIEDLGSNLIFIIFYLYDFWANQVTYLN